MESAYCTLPLFGDRCMRAFRYWEFSEMRGKVEMMTSEAWQRNRSRSEPATMCIGGVPLAETFAFGMPVARPGGGTSVPRVL
jgi:hypothetical protein